MKSFKQGVSYTLDKRKDYNWGSPAFGHTGPAYLDSITYKVVADATTREEAVEAGDAQVAYNPNVADIPTLERKGLSVGTPRYLGFVDGFYVQANQAPFNELGVRQAVQHAINRQEVLSTVYPPNFTTVAESFIQSNVARGPGRVVAVRLRPVRVREAARRRPAGRSATAATGTRTASR